MAHDTPSDLREHHDSDPEMPGDVAASVVPVPLTIGSVPTVEHDGRPWIVFRPTVETIGLGYPRQIQMLRRRSWAVVTHAPVVAADGKCYRTLITDVRTFLGWAMGIDEDRVRPGVRSALIAFQRETLDAVEAYWTRGLAVNPRGRIIKAAAVGLAGPVLDELHRAHCAGQVLAGRRDGDRATARRALGAHVERAYSAALDAGLVARQELAVADAAPIA